VKKIIWLLTCINVLVFCMANLFVVIQVLTYIELRHRLNDFSFRFLFIGAKLGSGLL
jgi:hypothetical protein